MWEEWRRASERYPKFVHEKWGAENFVDLSRNLSRFAKIKKTSAQTAAESQADVEARLARKEASMNRKSEASDVGGILIDEREVLSVLFQKVDDMGSDSEDDDEKDNIYSKLEVRQELKMDAEGHLIDTSGREACGYCEKVCFCALGHLNVRPYVLANGQRQATGPASLLGSGLLRPDDFREEATTTMAKLLAAQLENNTSGMPSKLVKEKYASRTDQLISSIDEARELAEEFKSGGGKRKDEARPVWSGEQAKEMLQMEAMQDLFHSHYSSPYEGEDISFNRKKRKSNPEPKFMSQQQLLEDYY